MRFLLFFAATITGFLPAAEVDPAAVLQPDAAISIRLPDLGRSRTRWDSTPYARLLTTAWGRVLISEWTWRLGQAAAPGIEHALNDIRAIAIGIAPGAAGTLDGVVAITGPQQPLQQLFAGITHRSLPGLDGKVEHRDGILTWTNGPRREPVAPSPIPDREADLVAVVYPQRCLSFTSAVAPAPIGWSGPATISVCLDPIGLRETITIPPTAFTRDAANLSTCWADPSELRALPATTLCALTWQIDPAVVRAAFTLAGNDAASLHVADAALAQHGLPNLRETALASTSPSVVWLTESVPFPTCTLALGLEMAVAQRWIAGLAAKLNLVAATDGSFAGHVGLLAVTIGWIPGAGPGLGHLIITTDRAGLDVWRKRTPGFAAAPSIAAVLDQSPSRCVAIGASRSGASWGALTQLIVPLFITMGAPQIMNLPADLQAIQTSGHLYLTLAKDGTYTCNSGGLLGGPATFAAILPASLQATVWVQVQQLREQERLRPLKSAAPEPRTF